jgi:hypothetical protein
MAGDSGRIGVEPEMWFLIFAESTPHRWLEWLAWGRFKHVLAFGWVPDQRSWLVYEVSTTRTRVAIMPDCPGSDERIAELRAGNVTLAMKPGPDRAPWARIGFWCVPAIAHLVGLKAQPLRPDALYRACLAEGAEVVTW